MHPDAQDTCRCHTARDLLDVQQLQELQGHWCPPLPCSTPRAQLVPRSPFATNVTSAPSQWWEKSSWNFNIASPTRGWQGADSAATRYACLGWKRAAREISSMHHTKTVWRTLKVYVKSSVTENSTWKLARQQHYVHTHICAHRCTQSLLLNFIQVSVPLELSPVDRKDRTECNLLVTTFFIQYYTSYQQKKS